MNKRLTIYILLVFFMLRSYSSAQAKLQAVTTPIITASGPVTFCQGGSVTLTASPTGGGSYQNGETYQWQLEGVNITGATASSLLVMQAGSYKVRITSGVESATSAALQVTVNLAPLVITTAGNAKCGASASQLKASSTSLYFNGITSKIPLSAYYDVTKRLTDISNTFTFECWVNPLATHEIDAQSSTNASGTTGQRYLSFPLHGGNWSSNGTHAGFGLSVGTNGVSVYEHAAGYMPATLVWQGQLNGWNHIAVVYESGKPRLYVNGVLAKAGVNGTAQFVHPTTYLLGGDSYGYYKGYLDQIRIWNVAKTPEQVSANMNSFSIPSNSPSLIAYWSADEGSGTQLNDLTSRANHGVLNNTTTWHSTVNASGFTWAPADKLDVTSGFNVNATGAGIYTVSTMDINGCTASNSIDLNDMNNTSVTITADRLQVCSTPKPVIWRNTYRCNITDNGIVQTVNSGWFAGAESMQQITGDGYLEYAIEAGNFPRMLGLGTPNNNTANNANNYNFCNYQFYMDNGTLYVYEGPTWKKTVGAYQEGDKIRIAREKTEIRFYFKNALVWTNTSAITSPLIVDASLNMPNAPFRNVKINNALDPVKFTANPAKGNSYDWKINNVIVATTVVNTYSAVVYSDDVVKCSVTYDNCTNPFLSNELTIGTLALPAEEITINQLLNVCPAPEPVVWRNMTNCELGLTEILTYSIKDWDSRAESLQQIATNGYVEYEVDAVNQIKMFGLTSPYNGNSNYSFINYAFYVNNSGIAIYQNGIHFGNFGAIAPGDLMRISLENGTVRYFKNNILIQTSAVGASPGLVAAICFAKSPSTFTLEKIRIQKSNSLAAMEITSPSTLSGVYQWFVNHNSVGANSKTLSQTGLINRDEVKLVFLPTDKCRASSDFKRTVTSATATLASVSIEPANLSVCPAPEEVIWKNFTRSTASGSVLNSTSTTVAWNSCAESVQQIIGSGYIEYMIESTAHNRMIGLGAPDNNDPNYPSLKYGFYLVPGGALQIYESGTKIDKGWTYASTQKIRIAIDRGLVRYYQNGSLLYTSPNKYTTALVADVAMASVGGSFNTVTIQKSNTGQPLELNAGNSGSGTYQWYLNNISLPFISSSLIQTGLIGSDKVKVTFVPSDLCSTHATSAVSEITSNMNPLSDITLSSPNLSVCPSPEIVVWKDLIKCEATSTGIVKSDPANNWGAVSAQSAQKITGNGHLEYMIEDISSDRMIGLSTINSATGYGSIKYAFYLSGNRRLYIFENGKNMLDFGPFTHGNKIRVSSENGSIKYYYNNILIYRSLAPMVVSTSDPLIADLDFYTNNASFNYIYRIPIQEQRLKSQLVRLVKVLINGL